MSRLILCATLLALTACTSSDDAVSALEAMGLKEITTTGYCWFGCSEDDTFHTGFEATNAEGKRVTGVVCSGVLKGATVRFD